MRNFCPITKPVPQLAARSFRPLNGGEHAFVLFNRGKAPAEIKVGWDQLNLSAGLKANVKDRWSKKVARNVRGSYGGTVAPHGVLMVRITPAP